MNFVHILRLLVVDTRTCMTVMKSNVQVIHHGKTFDHYSSLLHYSQCLSFNFILHLGIFVVLWFQRSDVILSSQSGEEVFSERAWQTLMTDLEHDGQDTLHRFSLASSLHKVSGLRKNSLFLSYPLMQSKLFSAENQYNFTAKCYPILCYGCMAYMYTGDTRNWPYLNTLCTLTLLHFTNKCSCVS